MKNLILKIIIMKNSNLTSKQKLNLIRIIESIAIIIAFYLIGKYLPIENEYSKIFFTIVSVFILVIMCNNIFYKKQLLMLSHHTSVLLMVFLSMSSLVFKQLNDGVKIIFIMLNIAIWIFAMRIVFKQLILTSIKIVKDKGISKRFLYWTSFLQFIAILIAISILLIL